MNSAETTTAIANFKQPELPRLSRSLPAWSFILGWATFWTVIGLLVATGLSLGADVDFVPALGLSMLFADLIGFSSLISARVIFPRLTELPYLLFLPLQILTLLSVTVAGSIVIVLVQPLFFAATPRVVVLIIAINSALAVAVGIALYTYDTMRRQIAKQYNQLRQQETMERQMRVARDVQEHLLPASPPQLAGLELAGRCIPARDVGGDYFDFVQLPDDRLAIVIGDVSGKGVPAALLMAGLQASVRSLAPTADSPSALNERINELLYESSSASRYATFLLGIYDLNSHQFRFSNAGHHPPLRVRNRAVSALGSGSGFPLGMFDVARYEESESQLQIGDLLALYTDGLVETPNADGEEFGEERFAALLAENAEAPLETVATRLLGALNDWAGELDAHDDATIVLLRAR